LSRQLDLVTLDQRVREELLAHPFDLGLGRDGVLRLDFEFDDPPDPRFADREAELTERGFDRLALGIQDPLLRGDQYPRFHRNTTSGSAR
jgi:hypothetical protein